jgi:hypothetical protein
MTKTVRTDIAPGVTSDCRVVSEIDIEGTPHFIVCTREEPAPKIYGLRDAGQIKLPKPETPDGGR